MNPDASGCPDEHDKFIRIITDTVNHSYVDIISNRSEFDSKINCLIELVIKRTGINVGESFRETLRKEWKDIFMKKSKSSETTDTSAEEKLNDTKRGETTDTLGFVSNKSFPSSQDGLSSFNARERGCG